MTIVCLKTNLYIKKLNNQNNQDIAHHASSPLLTIPHFQSYRTKETFQIFHNLSWKSESLIYLLQCHICQLHYAGKGETHFNIRLNNNRKDAKSQYSILVCKHCYKQDHDFRHAEFTLIEQINTQPLEKQEHIK